MSKYIMMVSFKTCLLYNQTQGFSVYIFNGRKQTLVNMIGILLALRSAVCMTSAIFWPNCVFAIVGIHSLWELAVVSFIVIQSFHFVIVSAIMRMILSRMMTSSPSTCDRRPPSQSRGRSLRKTSGLGTAAPTPPRRYDDSPLIVDSEE